MINFLQLILRKAINLIVPFIFILGFINALYAQDNIQDVVYLKNGSIIRGMIIEQVPNQSLKIRTNDGSLFVYQFDQIEKITKETPPDSKKPKTVKTGKAETNTNNSIRISPYFSIGVTAAAPSLEDLEFYYSDLYERDLNPLAIGGGIQALFAVKSVWLGVDIGAKKTFKSTASYDMDLIYSTGYTEQIDKETAVNILFLAQYDLNSYLFLQGGLGTYMSSWFYSYEYRNSDYYDSYDYVEYTGTGWNFGLMLAGGTHFPITENIFIPLYLRFDLMFRYGIMVPITVNSGITIAL